MKSFIFEMLGGLCACLLPYMLLIIAYFAKQPQSQLNALFRAFFYCLYFYTTNTKNRKKEPYEAFIFFQIFFFILSQTSLFFDI